MKQLFLSALMGLISFGIIGQPTEWTEKNLKEHWEANGMDQFEGLYQQLTTTNHLLSGSPQYILAVLKTKDGYQALYLDVVGEKKNEAWNEGEIKIYLWPREPTPKIFDAWWVKVNKEASKNCRVVFNEDVMDVYVDKVRFKLVKYYPSQIKIPPPAPSDSVK